MNKHVQRFMKQLRTKAIIKSITILFIIAPNLVLSQDYSGNATYTIKLAEDNLSFNSTLEFNEKESIFISKQRNKSDWRPEKGFKFQIVYTDTIGHTVYRNKSTNQLTVRTFCGKSNPLIFDDNIEFDWKISDQEKEIQGIMCQNAQVTFRGRAYEAWFAPSIPTSVGPWKFFGLPGLIFEIKDSSEEIFIAISALDIEQTTKIIPHELSGKKLTRNKVIQCEEEEWMKFIKRNNAKIAQLQAEFPEITITDNGASEKPRSKTELTY